MERGKKSRQMSILFRSVVGMADNKIEDTRKVMRCKNSLLENHNSAGNDT